LRAAEIAILMQFVSQPIVQVQVQLDHPDASCIWTWDWEWYGFGYGYRYGAGDGQVKFLAELNKSEAPAPSGPNDDEASTRIYSVYWRREIDRYI